MVRVHKTVSLVLAAAPLALGVVTAFGQGLTPVPAANPKVPGLVAPTILSPELAQVVRAAGAYPVENPGDNIGYYGYGLDGPMIPALGTNLEATKTEPDKNTYLVVGGLSGPDSGYDYGRHFLFQGHESGPNGQGAITRINLDADGAHRVTLLATKDKDNKPLPSFDGSTWYPWAGRLLFTNEFGGGATGGVWQATLDFPSVVEDISGVMGRGGYEGIQADADGNIWIVEDIGGSTVGGAKVPNSFVYRFIPKNKHDLTKGGKLQALQVMKLNGSGPIVFDGTNALTPDVKDLHTYGNVFDTKWVLLHDTAVDGTTPFNANDLAKKKLATPFKRPENGQFRPGSHFREFFFDETGDTSISTTAGAAYGGFGGILKLTQRDPSANTGKLTLFYLGDAQHTGLDNVAFWDENHIVFVEDAGDSLHAQRNALDSAYMFDVFKNYADPANQPIRIIAQGRDASATLDSGLLGTANFKNDGDNELTGIHVSDGDATPDGLLGARVPRLFRDGWRAFYTHQHGDNLTYEIVRNTGRGHSDDD